MKRSKKTILIVDDEEAVLRTIERILVLNGYNALKAENGKKAIRMYKKHISEIDLIILDYALPDFNGIELYDEFKILNYNVKIIIASGLDVEELRLHDHTLEYLQKPFDVITLLDAIKKLL